MGILCWVVSCCVWTVFYVAMVHVCDLRRWQPLGLWAAPCWWIHTESCKPPVCPAALDTSPGRMQPRNKHTCVQHCSSACRKCYPCTAGYSFWELKPKRGMLGAACSDMTHSLMHFMDQHQGVLCISSPAFPLPCVLGSHCVPFPGGGCHCSNAPHGCYFTVRRKGHRQMAPSTPRNQRKVTRDTLNAQKKNSKKTKQKKGAHFSNSKPCTPVCLRRSYIALRPLKIVLALEIITVQICLHWKVDSKVWKKEKKQTRIWNQRQGST